VKTLYNDQARVQSTESSIYTTIVKAFIYKNTEFHTYKLRQYRSFRVALKNVHPSTDVNSIKRGSKRLGARSNEYMECQRKNEENMKKEYQQDATI